MTENRPAIAKTLINSKCINTGKDESLNYFTGKVNNVQKPNINVNLSKNPETTDKKASSFLTNNTNTFNIFCGTSTKDMKDNICKTPSKTNLQGSQIDIKLSNDKKLENNTRNPHSSYSNISFFRDNKLDIVMEALDFKEYGEIFLRNKVKFEDLFILSKEDLIELKIPLGPRNRILKFVEEFMNFSNIKEHYSEKLIQRFFEIKNFTNFLTYSEINTENSNQNSIRNHNNNSINANQSEIAVENKFSVGSPSFGVALHNKIPTPNFNNQLSSEVPSNRSQKTVNSTNKKKTLLSSHQGVKLETVDNRYLKEYMINHSKELSPHHNDKLFNKLDKNSFENFKKLQNDMKLKTSQNSFISKRNSVDKHRSSSSRIDNSSSKSFSFKTKQKKTKTIDYDVDNESNDDASIKQNTHRNGPIDQKKSGNFLTNSVFSKSNVDIFAKNRKITATETMSCANIVSKSPKNMTTSNEKPISINKDIKLNYNLANRQLISKEYHLIEEKVILIINLR